MHVGILIKLYYNKNIYHSIRNIPKNKFHILLNWINNPYDHTRIIYNMTRYLHIFFIQAYTSFHFNNAVLNQKINCHPCFWNIFLLYCFILKIKIIWVISILKLNIDSSIPLIMVCLNYMTYFQDILQL